MRREGVGRYNVSCSSSSRVAVYTVRLSGKAMILEGSRGCCGQDIKGVRGMTRHLEAMKDVETCDKPRGGGNNRYYPGISEWGNLAG